MSTTEYKLQTIWSIKKEMNIKNLKELSSEKFDTTLPNIQYFICIDNESGVCYDYEILVQFIFHEKETGNDLHWCENISYQKIDLYIDSANYQDDLLKRANLGCCFNYGIKFDLEELLNPDNKYFVNDILTLKICGIIKYKKTELNLGNFLWEKDDKDFKFIVGNNTIMAHKLIVRQFSSVFAAAIDSDEYKIDNFSRETVTDALKLCYGVTPSFKYSKERLWNMYATNCLFKLIEFTTVYDMPLIKEQIENEIEKLINAKTICKLANESLELKADILRSFCVNFLSDCIKNGKPFNGTLNDLKPEIVALVFKSSFCHTQTS